ncbi:phage holin family protein [Kitasatospora indigofera]|uniref:phage holin family protein n=1 Tax=Kitasatospora indigofera TaxID=67307 RepID=UPI003570D373
MGALAARASQQMSRLVRERLRLARAEKREKGRRLGAGGGGCWTARGCSGC